MKVAINAIDSAFPRETVTNEDLGADFPDTSFDQLAERTGVLQRQIAGTEETALDFAVRAFANLTEQGGWSLDDIGAIIFCTQTPDYPITPNACLLHGELGFERDVPAFDINLACSGYVYGLQVAQGLILGGVSGQVLLATGDTYSRLIHPGDRSTRCLFGDGAAVSLIGPSDGPSGLIDIKCGTAGAEYKRFMVRAGGARIPKSAKTSEEFSDRSGNIRTAENIEMDGLGVLSFFSSVMPKEVRSILEANDLTITDIDVFVFHQASRIAVDSLVKQLELPTEKVVCELETVGNLVSASIPHALQQAMVKGSAKPGDLAVLCGFGVGLSWGTAIVRL